MMRLNSAGLRVNGTFVSSSDRNQKEAFAPVEPREVLEKVAALPLSEWNYKQDPTSRHIGPMAQDFHAAFGVGPDDRHIATVDADGVALAAIQGLNQKVEEQATALREREAQIARLESELSELRSLVLRSFNPPAARQP
ncbi:MAG: tail fiber domain-containing protein [Verrucomicrobiales bacterium]|nr:tail fiber domain-containing protein [Verrucomicrobiales bacterium]